MDQARYFRQRANECAAAAHETKDRWFAQRLSALAAEFAALAAATQGKTPLAH
jgi:hypothetical protein